MARVHLLLCFTILFASVTLFDVASAFLKLKPSLPKIEDPKTVADVEGYTVKVVMVFVGDLEKECPKTSKFKMFFDKLRGFAKFVCPLNLFRKKDDAEVKSKEDGIIKTIASFAVGRIKREIQEEKEEAIETFKFMKTLGGKILGGRKKEEKEETMTLTPEQLKEIKDGILKWQTVITKVVNTMVVSTTTTTTTTNEGSDSATTTPTAGDSSSPNSGTDTGSPSNKPSAGSNPGAGAGTGTGTPSKDTDKPSAGSNPGAGTGTPSKDTDTPSAGSNPGAETETPSMDTDKPSAGSNPGAETGTPSKDTDTPSAGSNPGAGNPSKDTNNQSNSASSETKSTTTSQTKEVTVTEVETQTSEQVMAFLMNLEKKCPPKDEYKQFFEQLKSTMTGSAKVASPKRKGLFARIKGAVGKIGDAMKFIRSRITGKSAEVKKSMETFQTEVIKSMEELDAIHAKIVAQNQSKKGGTMTCTPEQQAEIKTTITKWEQVTTQFVEVAIKSETSTTSSTETSSTGKAQAN